MLEVERTGQCGCMSTRSGQNVLVAEKLINMLRTKRDKAKCQ